MSANENTLMLSVKYHRMSANKNASFKVILSVKYRRMFANENASLKVKLSDINV